ncbi:hypothetical protein FUA23_18805 [Neolewinella aurantiaca]|uniref:Uncharacterized protein n=1 Tax=Neolewinella aurantiaca TaxID=2602767 RepID=A0A5C7FNX6_9BACT|nr:hypothetical protein [Neolewinella aurantiaca]TXF87046.1 hypothetical protein FUA23_18805 [Neolewinella aurantiaca]
MNIVRVVDTSNSYRWSDESEVITFPPELNTVTICRQGDADGNLIGAFDKSNGLDNNTKLGLIRK